MGYTGSVNNFQYRVNSGTFVNSFLYMIHKSQTWSSLSGPVKYSDKVWALFLIFFSIHNVFYPISYGDLLGFDLVWSFSENAATCGWNQDHQKHTFNYLASIIQEKLKTMKLYKLTRPFNLINPLKYKLSWSGYWYDFEHCPWTTHLTLFLWTWPMAS